MNLLRPHVGPDFAGFDVGLDVHNVLQRLVDSESVLDSRIDTTFLSELAHAFFHFINVKAGEECGGESVTAACGSRLRPL